MQDLFYKNHIDQLFLSFRLRMDFDHGELSGKQFPLPVDIIVIILSMLPVKSLIRFKCVSRPWRSLISSARFITLHTKKAADNRQVFLQRRRVMFNPIYFRLGLYSINLDQFLHDNADHPYNGSIMTIELDFFQKEVYPRDFWPIIRVIYFCNNLLLCSVSFDLYLVNPGTRELKKLPKRPTWRPRPAVRACYIQNLCGLGFDHTTNDYKVVHGQKYGDGIMVYSVYTLRDDSWRQIESHSRYRPSYKSGIFLNGAIHWYVIKRFTNGGSRPVILTFRLDDEEFDEIQLPLIRHIRSSMLGVFRDCLCITFTGERDQPFDEFWVMKEYRSSESWTKVSLPRLYTVALNQIGFSTESHDVMLYENSFVTYKGFREGDGKLQVRDQLGIRGFAGAYVEGLFPLAYR